MPTDIADVAESLRLDFGETARWRREKAAEHPEDSRNVEAAELLDRLAKTIKDVDPTLLDACGALCIKTVPLVLAVVLYTSAWMFISASKSRKGPSAAA